MSPVLAIDSLPLSESIHTSYDYSGQQVYLLTSSALSKHLKHAKTLFNTLGKKTITTIKIPLLDNNKWSNGKKVTPSDYKRGIAYALEKNIFLRKFLFKALIKIESNKDFLILYFNGKNNNFFDLLKIPSFCPLHGSDKNLSCGKWVLVKKDRKSYFYKPNPYNTDIKNNLEVRLVKTPEENLNHFLNNEISVTADTAFPLYKYDKLKTNNYLKRSSIKLNCQISFGKLFHPRERLKDREIIHSIVQNIDFHEACFNQCVKTEDQKLKKLKFFSIDSSTQHKITLAYDNYYPNKETAMKVSHALRKNGFTVELKEDSYYSPYVEYDLKIEITKPLCNSRYTRYASLLFSPILKTDKTLQNHYLKLFKDAESKDSFLSEKLDIFISKNILECPIFNIPSICLSKLDKNPLTEQLECV